MQQISSLTVYGLRVLIFSFQKHWKFSSANWSQRHRLHPQASYKLNRDTWWWWLSICWGRFYRLSSQFNSKFFFFFLFSIFSLYYTIYISNITLCQRNRLHQISGIQQLHIHKGTYNKSIHKKKKSRSSFLCFSWFYVNVLIHRLLIEEEEEKIENFSTER